MLRKFIFGLNPSLLMVICLLPGIFLLAKDLIPSILILSASIAVSFIISLWFWEINKAIDKLTEERKIQRLLQGFIIVDFLISIFWLLMRYKDSRELFLEPENSFRFIRVLTGVRMVCSVVIAILTTVRLKKILVDRTSWFMFMELLFPILGILNLTGLVKEELRDKGVF